ncbi:MAG: magnesium transporter [Bdellovibrionaceae bacterium]|nr:magnesium transporter [Pseudobdellovibrionaceae bacterium]
MKLNAANAAIIRRLLVGRNNRPLRSILKKLSSHDLASLVNTLNKRELRLFIEALLVIKKAVETLIIVPEQQLEDALRKIEAEQQLRLIDQSDFDDAAYFLSLLTVGEQNELLAKVEKDKAEKIRQYLSHPEGSAGRMMHARVFHLPVELNAKEALSFLREKAQTMSIYYIYCVNEHHQLSGIISLRQLATAPEDKPLTEILKEDIVTVFPEEPAERAAELVSHYDLIAIPVISHDRELLGIVTVDDILDIIQEQATADIYAQAGLQEDDRVFTPAKESIKKRIPWMFINLLLAAVASSVVSLFENTMSHLIILASLKNIVAGMGGNTAIQSLTVVTRGLATGDFSFISHTKAIIKEVSVGFVIGILTGIGAGLLTYVWKGNLMVSIVICISMIINSLLAAIAGATVPLMLKKMGWDPAAGSGVLVTMFTDIVSFFSFLGIATIGLKMFGV